MYTYPHAAGYNTYVELIGGAIGVGACAAVRRGNKIYTIDDDIPLLHFLSGHWHTHTHTHTYTLSASVLHMSVYNTCMHHAWVYQRH